jgi:hypothetical protein
LNLIPSAVPTRIAKIASVAMKIDPFGGRSFLPTF